MPTITPIIIYKTTDSVSFNKNKEIVNILTSGGPNNESCGNTF